MFGIKDRIKNTANYLNELNNEYWSSGSLREFLAYRLIDRKKMNEEIDELLKSAKNDGERIELLRGKLNNAYDDKEKLLKEIYELKQENQQKDLRIKELEQNKNISLDSVEQKERELKATIQQAKEFFNLK